MIRLEDVKDRDSLRDWLMAQDSYEISVTLAARAALRIQPVLWESLSPARSSTNITALVFVRSSLIARVAGNCFFPAIRDASAYAAHAVNAAEKATVAAANAGSVTNAVADAASSTAATASAAATATADVTTAGYAANAYTYASLVAAAGAASWAIVRSEATCLLNRDDVWRNPLWSDELTFQSEWSRVRGAWETAGAPWDFFAEMYDGFIKGTPPDWTLLEQVAHIAPEDWDAGPDRVALRIIEILKDHKRAKQSPTPPTDVIRQNAGANADTLPVQIAALVELLEVEAERLRGKNPSDDHEAEDVRRLYEVFVQMKTTLLALAAELPEAGAPTEGQAEEIAGLLSVFACEFQKWPRENAADLVDGTCRVGLVGLTAGLFATFGVPTLAAVAVGGLVFGGKRIADIRAASKEIGPPP